MHLSCEWHLVSSMMKKKKKITTTTAAPTSTTHGDCKSNIMSRVPRYTETRFLTWFCRFQSNRLRAFYIIYSFEFKRRNWCAVKITLRYILLLLYIMFIPLAKRGMLECELFIFSLRYPGENGIFVDRENWNFRKIIFTFDVFFFLSILFHRPSIILLFCFFFTCLFSFFYNAGVGWW